MHVLANISPYTEIVDRISHCWILKSSLPNQSESFRALVND